MALPAAGADRGDFRDVAEKSRFRRQRRPVMAGQIARHICERSSMTTKGAAILALGIVVATLLAKLIPASQPATIPTPPARFQAASTNTGWVLILDTETGQAWSHDLPPGNALPRSDDFWSKK